MARAVSAAQLSQAMPVREKTRRVMPWSLWPAVPTMAFEVMACRSGSGGSLPLARGESRSALAPAGAEQLASDAVDGGAVGAGAEARQHLLHDRPDRRRTGEAALGDQRRDGGADLAPVGPRRQEPGQA